MDFHTMTRRPRYICERYAYLTTVGDLKDKIVNATVIGGLLKREDLHIFFRGQSLANDDILHSVIDDEVIVHVTHTRGYAHTNAMAPPVKEMSKQLWSMA